MNLRTRLRQLERRVVPPWQPPAPNVPPPCPPWFEPEAWASRLRTGDCLLALAEGRIGPEDILPGCTAAEMASAVTTWRLAQEMFPEPATAEESAGGHEDPHQV
jgi:hypothetical protein